MPLDSTTQIESLTDTNFPKKPKITIESDRLKTVGLLHAWGILLIPFLGFVVAIALVGSSGIKPWQLGLLIAMYTLTLGGITVGFHRHFTHSAFRTNTPMRVILAILGSMAAQGSLLYWVSNHRRHHQYSDQPLDPHSPNLQGESLLGQLRGLFHAHMGWMFHHEFANPIIFAKDLIKDPIICAVNRLYFWWIVLGLVIPAIVGGLLTWTWMGVFQGFLWGGLVRIFLAHHATWSINSITHLYGTRPFDTREQSTNNSWLAIPTGGEAWHNNHHAFPNSALFGLKWWQIDWGGWVIRTLEFTGLVWDVKMPTVEAIKAKNNYS
ncbi:acyl-CoA desaturase [Coleofasciculus sp. LEGE 07092]|nr:acyl-CoA desaturase [Coleofasciculus sp. LEGE 07081]MBE9151495.1 acyl-CoA desaturase [Coleofasciculus sp. LEGE 07092]